MRERLREIAQLTLRTRIVFLGQQADIVTKPDQPFEQRARLAAPPCRIRLSASQKLQARNMPSPGGNPSTSHASDSALPAIDGSSRWIAATVPLMRGSSGGRKPIRGSSSRLASRYRCHSLHEALLLGAVALAADRIVNALPQRTPLIQPRRQVELLGTTDRAVHCDPGHRFGEGEMPGAAAHFPDALVRLVPDLHQVIDQLPLNVPAGIRPRQTECIS